MKNRFLHWLKITFHSFFVSLGVLLSFIFIGVIYTIVILVIELTEYLIFNDKFQSQPTVEISNPSGIKIEWIESRKSPTMVIFVGEVKKTDDRKYRHIEITVKLFDKDDKYVDDCSDLIFLPFKASKTKTFKIKCGGSCGYPHLEFSKYDANILARTLE